jgi:hypothetical protein
MFNLETIGLPVLGHRGLEADLTEEEQAIQEMAHRFAEEVMRPIGEKLDNLMGGRQLTAGFTFTCQAVGYRELLGQLQNFGLCQVETN